ncbi:YbaB/EbfC family nucleoid-associated protein [Amycolatopsis sp. cmx-11-12]|uniref:YbaB/EbfC family nucleoid-associated protein n=1 Tax=Amycolatopsis sp. cmx-11-12 TaxID=2785795 RepID=UPI003916E4B2
METSVNRYDDYRRMAEELRTAQDRIAELRATAESGDGLISATVGGYGELVELHLDPRIYRVPDSAELARSIKDTIHRATESAQEQCSALVAGHLPEDTTTTTTREPAELRFGPALHVLDRQIAGELR